MREHAFAIRSRDEVWELAQGVWLLRELREDAGACVAQSTRGTVTQESSSDIEGLLCAGGWKPAAELLDSPIAQSVELAPVPEANGSSAIRVRVHDSIRWVASSFGTELRRSRHAVVSTAESGRFGSLLVQVDNVPAAIERLLTLAKKYKRGLTPSDSFLPILWVGGAASILFHEALGHPAETGGPHLQWPAWLTVSDDPSASGPGAMRLDDTGGPVVASVLTRGGRPACHRRASFGDSPLHRMTNLVVHANPDAPMDVPARRLEVRLISAGSYEVLDDHVELAISDADQVDETGRSHLAPFRLRVRRDRLAHAILGARDDPVTYPGVLCSREGQRIAVGSSACDLLTGPLVD